MMNANDTSVSEDFIRMIQVLAEEERFRNWFLSLQPMAENLKYSVLGSMVEQMKENQENPDFILAVQSLMNPIVYNAVVKTILNLQK
jgi:hypothetical protein